MNNVSFRRIALSFAAVCFGLSATALLLCSILYINLLQEQSKIESKMPKQSFIQFPSRIENTDLVIQNMAVYDGMFSEDGSNAEVFDLAAIVVKNTGANTILYAHIELTCSDQCLLFEAAMLPPHSTTLIPEKTQKKLSDGEIINHSGWTVYADQQKLTQIQINPVSIGTVEVINNGSNQLSDIKLYHKTYLLENNMYIGGAAVETSIEYLLPGQSIQITPEQYAQGYSKFVYVS